MNWNKIWNERRVKTDTLYDYNGYLFNSDIEFMEFIDKMFIEFEIKDGSVILDIGCGNGAALQLLLKNRGLHNCKVYGIDICTKNIEYAQNNYTGNYTIHDIHNPLDFVDNLFDVIFCSASILYLKNIDYVSKLMDECKRVSKSVFNMIFAGNMDKDKYTISLERRKETHNWESTHTYIEKNKFYEWFPNCSLKITDCTNLDIPFYKCKDYKFNVIVSSV